MEMEAWAKNNNSKNRIYFCLAAEFIRCAYLLYHQSYSKDTLILYRLNLLNFELSEINDTVFDRATLTNYSWCIFNNTKQYEKTLISTFL